jgi:cytochrome c nitrite reductase small subunit
LALAVSLGALGGIGTFTLRYAEGLSYFEKDPAACANCHIMQANYDFWQKSSHHTVAVCDDCHLPSDFFPKYLAKAENGWRHGKLFTTGGFVEPIRLQEAGRKILQANCEGCHAELTAQMLASERPHGSFTQFGPEPGLECIHCHADVGHGPFAGVGGPPTPEELSR